MNNIHVLSRAVILDQDHVLLCKTLDLPKDFFFLPGGHIHHGESAQIALIRELVEETGRECYIKRFLGCLEYNFEPGYSSICHNHEYNFVFEVGSEVLKIGNEISSLEQHLALVWMPLNRLSELDFRAEPLKQLIPQWLREPRNNLFKSVMI